MPPIHIVLQQFAGKNVPTKCVKYDDCPTCCLKKYCSYHQSSKEN